VCSALTVFVDWNKVNVDHDVGRDRTVRVSVKVMHRHVVLVGEGDLKGFKDARFAAVIRTNQKRGSVDRHF